jgi:hypothetical protein
MGGGRLTAHPPLTERITMKGLTGTQTYTLAQEPPIAIPPPPDDAPHEQIMDFAAVAGAFVVSMHPTTRSRIAQSYMDRWHPRDPHT